MPIATRTFRVFVSSTFEDLVEERNALHRDVFPKLTEVCEAHGARFQAIDLRWGVRDEAVLGQQMMEVCLGEIQRCQRTGIKPNFISLVGDRYGKPPLPSRIQAGEFKTVLSRIDSAEHRAFVETWYQLDENAVPPEYLLKPRTGEFVDGNHWREVEDPMREALRRAAQSAGLSGDDLLKYEGSASHQEIVKGLGKTPEDRKHVFAFLRATDIAREPVELRKLKGYLRTQLGDDVVEYNAGEMENLCSHIKTRLQKVMLDEISQFESQSPLEHEKDAHNIFARERCQHFVGRQHVLATIDAYLDSNDPRLLVVHGPSGSGKSAIIAKASEEREGIRRFIGTTPAASEGTTLLRSLCEEIGKQYGQAPDLPATFNELAVLFQDRLRLATPDRPLFLYIDAIDQFGEQDPAVAMNWLPSELPPYCRVVISATDIPATLESGQSISIEPFSILEAGETLDSWFQDARRTLRRDQREKLLESFKRIGLPLYLKLAFEEARLWRSFDPIEKCTLGDGLPAIIDQLFARLSEAANHGVVFVSHVFGYLTAARYGLTEDEVLAVLGTDQEVWADFERTKKHDLPQDILSEDGKAKRQLPVIVWSRLHLDLEPYLTERSVPGGVTISFYHKQLADRAAAFKSRERGISHSNLARYFQLVADPAEDWSWRGRSIRPYFELPFQLASAGDREQGEKILSDLGFVMRKATHCLVDDLVSDYERFGFEAFPAETPWVRCWLHENRVGVQCPFCREWFEWGHTTTPLEGEECPYCSNLMHIRSTPIAREWSVSVRCRGEQPPRPLNQQRVLREVDEFARFILAKRQILMEFPELLFQLALNAADNSALCRAAHSKEPQHSGPWLRLMNKKTITAADYVVLAETRADGTLKCIFSPDGRFLASADPFGGIRVWSVQGARLRWYVKQHSHFATCTYSHDGSRIVTASSAQVDSPADDALQFRVLAADSGALLISRDYTRSQIVGSRSGSLDREAPNSLHTRCAHSPTGPLCAVSLRELVLLINSDTGDILNVAIGHKWPVTGCAFSPDGETLVSTDPLRIWLWDSRTGKSRIETDIGILGAFDGLTCCAFSQIDDSFLVGAERLSVWNSKTRAGVQYLSSVNVSDSKIFSLATCPSGSHLVCGTEDGRVAIATISQQEGNLEIQRLAQLTGFSGPVLTCAISPGGQYIASGVGTAAPRIWNLSAIPSASQAELAVSPVKTVIIAQTGLRAVTTHVDGSILIWNTRTAEHVLAAAPLYSATEWYKTGSSVEISECTGANADGSLLLVVDSQGNVQLIDWSAGRRLWNSLNPQKGGRWDFYPLRCEFSRDESRVVILFNQHFRILDSSGNVLCSIGSARDPVEIYALSPDGRYVVVLSKKAVRVVNLKYTGRIHKKRRSSNPGAAIRRCFFEPNSSHLLVVFDKQQVEVWQFESDTGSCYLAAPALVGSKTREGCFSPEGSKFLSCSRGGGEILNLDDAERPTYLLLDRMRDPTCSSFSPDGRAVLMCADEVLMVWRSEDGERVMEFQASGRILSASWSPDGSSIVCVDRFGALSILELRNVTMGPLILTAVRSPADGTLAFSCPRCGIWTEIADSMLGAVGECECGTEVVLNRFVNVFSWGRLDNNIHSRRAPIDGWQQSITRGITSDFDEADTIQTAARSVMQHAGWGALAATGIAVLSKTVRFPAFLAAVLATITFVRACYSRRARVSQTGIVVRIAGLQIAAAAIAAVFVGGVIILITGWIRWLGVCIMLAGGWIWLHAIRCHLGLRVLIRCRGCGKHSVMGPDGAARCRKCGSYDVSVLDARS